MIREYLDKYKNDFKNCINDFKSIKTWYKQIPNLLTVSRIIGLIPVNILFFTGNVIPAIILTGLLLSTDLIDGKLARKWKVNSKFGADLDAVCDKLMFLGLSLPLIGNFPMLILNFLLEGAISLVNVLGRINGVDTKTVFIGKVKTVALSLTLGIGYLVRFLKIPVDVLRLFTLITGFLQGCSLVEYISEYKNMLNKKVIDEVENNDKVQEKENCKEKSVSLVEQLKREKEFILATLEPGKVYKGKKRVRKILQEKRNS